ncbi:MAG: Gfo/Idh/MocA family oxidoreductase [Christensenellaceae bacterium]|jgi:predicted dehydrogenase|nr:Gfo/Idh/MocA family oxidoreductase [Christensenellaceae bacterium]
MRKNAKCVKFAVIGIGRMGSIHAHHLMKARVKNATLSAVCDIDSNALTAFFCKHKKIPAFSDYREIMEKVEIDAVIIAVPHYFHIEIAEYFLRHNKHVLIEKPLGVDIKEAKRFLEFLENHVGSSAAIMYNQRTNKVYKKAKQIIDNNGIGTVRRISFIVTDWYRSDAYYLNNSWRASLKGEGGGILINQCVHQLDILTWFVGLPISICATMSTVNRKITTENDVTAVLEYQNGAMCSLNASGHELRGVNRIELSGDSGRILLGKHRAHYYSFSKSEPEVNEQTVAGYGSSDIKRKTFSYGIFRLIADAIYGQQIRVVRNFVDHILFGEELIAPAKDGIYALTLINGIYLSAWQNCEVRLPLDGDKYVEVFTQKREEENANN